MEKPPEKPPEKPTIRLSAPTRADRPHFKKTQPNKPGRPAANRPVPVKSQGGKLAPTKGGAGKFHNGKPHPPRKPNEAGVTDWNGVANWYDELVGDNGSEFHREVVVPGTLRLLAAGRGDRVLDVACGQGVLCRALAATGIEATGVDAAIDLIRAARDRQSQAPPTTLQ